LTQGGHQLADLVEAGLLKLPDDGGAPFDFYRGRVMFTIADTRDRTVSFGARTLDPDGQPKYLNGPDSPVFNKSRNLYRYAQARTAAKDKPIQAEVIAVGPGARDDSGKAIPMEVKVGDIVLFTKWGGTEIKIDGEDLLVLKETDIIGIVDKSASKKKAA
jgi:co-chaperonin GroES (HSP10)